VEESGSNQPIRFGPFEFHEATQELFNQSVRLRLSPQAFQVLRLLLQKPGHLIKREEFHQALWPADTFVDFDHGLNNAIKRIRDVLNDSAESPVYIETLPRLGYRFIGQIQPDPQSATASPKQAQPAEAASVPTGVNTRSFLSSGGRAKILALAALVVATFLVVIPLSNVRGRLSGHSGLSSTRIQSLAVLPLANLSGDPEQEYFADGLTEALIIEIGKTSIPRVISRQSVMQYKSSKKPLQEIARELNVDAVLEGTVVRSGDRVRVTVHLDRASPEGQLWASAYDRSVRDILGLQDEIARTVTDGIQVKLTPQERVRLTNARPVDPEAHDEYLRGRYILGMAVAHLSRFTDKKQYTALDILEAVGHFKHAIERDPAYAMAYAGLADAHIQLGNPVWGGHSPEETLAQAKEEANKALDLDPYLAEAHFSLAQTLEYEWNWPEAEKEFKLALKLNPNYADAHLEHGRFVQALGRNDEALREMNYAMELDPYDIRTKIVVAWVTWASHQYDLALKQFESLGDDWGRMCVYRENQLYPEALAALETWKLGHPSQHRHPHVLAIAAGIYGLEGRRNEAEKLIDELKETARHQYVSGFFFAEAYTGLGQKDQAVTWLERAYEDHDQWMVFAASYPGLDPLHSEPRFQALLRRMHFPQ